MGFRKYNVSKRLTDANQWTDTITPSLYNESGRMNISVIFGTGATSTVRLQRSFDDAVTWGTVKSYTASGENQLIDLEGAVIYRIGVATGEFGAAGKTVDVRLSM